MKIRMRQDTNWNLKVKNLQTLILLKVFMLVEFLKEN